MTCYVTCSGERRLLCAWEEDSSSTGKQEVTAGIMVTKGTIKMLEYKQRRRVEMQYHATKADADLNMARRIT